MSAAVLTSLWIIASAQLGQMGPNFIVHGSDGTYAAAPLLEIGADFNIKLGGKQPIALRGRDVISMRRAGVPQPANCPPPFLELTTGDRLPLAIPIRIQLEDESLQATIARPLLNDQLTVPQAAVAFIGLSSAIEANGKISYDSIVLKNGDALTGKLAGIDPVKGARLVVSGKTQIIPFERIAQIAFNPDFQARPRAKSMYGDIILAGGARLAVAKLTTTGPNGELAGISLLGHRFAFAAGDLVALRVRQGRAVYLDELKPKSYVAIPFLDVDWPLSPGRTLLGRALQIGEDVFPLGLAMHSGSKVTYPLGPEDECFEATVALDSSTGPRGAIKIDVALDGKSVPRVAQFLTATDPPVMLRVDLKDAKTLTLITDFGPRGDVQGHAIWADARLIHK